MVAPISIDRNLDGGHRCWIFGRRIHHGLAGIASMVLGLVAIVAGALLFHDDLEDWPFPLTRRKAR